VLPDAEALCDRVGIIAGGKMREIVTLQGAAEPDGYLLSVRRITAEALAALQRVSPGLPPPTATPGACASRAATRSAAPSTPCTAPTA
jgi:hypothetical protein